MLQLCKRINELETGKPMSKVLKLELPGGFFCNVYCDPVTNFMKAAFSKDGRG